jgi:RNase P/RNase MRP subunit POP5
MPSVARCLSFQERDLHAALRSVIEANFGDWGWCLLVPYLAIKYFDSETGTVILRAPREHHGLLWAACTLLDRLRLPASGRWISLQIRLVHVGGTLRSCHKRIVEAFRRELPFFLDENTLPKRISSVEQATDRPRAERD